MTSASAFADVIRKHIQESYPTGIAWMDRERNVVVVDWVDGSSDQITVVVHRVAHPEPGPGE